MSLFDALVDEYDAARPSYPAALYDALDRLAGPLRGARVVEVGAGTGIATRGLVDRGARVLAVDHGAAMLARLRSRTRGAMAVRADAHALPVGRKWADLVAYAQAWHWVDVPRAAAEAARVLRPGGALAAWWNDVLGGGVDWLQRQYDRIEAGNPAWSRAYRDRDYAAELGPGWRATTTTFRWERAMAIDDYLVWLRSKSYVAALGPRLPRFLAEERASLLAEFPDGVVVEPFRTLLVVARPG